MVSCNFDGHPYGEPPAPGGPPPSGAYTAYSGPPNKYNLGFRRFSSIPIIVLLYSAAMPFSPLGWFVSLEGAFLLDTLLAGVILLCGCFFQWQIAGLNSPLAISFSGPSRQTIRNGRMEAARGEMGFVWQTSNYWPYAICETMLLCLAEWGPSETLRRSIVCGILVGLWVVGWHATPQSDRRWAFEHIKAWWFWIILSELLHTGHTHRGRRAR
ncbi:hypothetical protein F5Y15DRAFT_62579 [Xylariaceae sp. FL0016]|nr:hypothetical protein F5Y15DRAFT_62579 [Xylariaceae sp. FL0016]